MRKPICSLFALLLSLVALFLVACPTEEERRETVLDIPIDKNNDSLLTFDTLIIKVYSKDSTFVQEVFHGKLTDPNKLIGLALDSRVGKEFTVSIIGYKGGKLGMHREVKVLNLQPSGIKDLPFKDTIKIEPLIPEILAPSDTSVAEGDSLKFRVSIRNPLGGATTLTLKNTLPGASLDTAGRGPGDGYFTWRPNLTQGRIEPYAVTFVYASADRKVEKTVSVKVLNTNQPPKIKTIADQKVKESEMLTFTVDAADPDLDSLTLAATGLPEGAAFSSGSFTWKPTVGQAGNYSVKFKAFDGKDSDFVAVLITVGDVDPPPSLSLEIISPAGDTSVNVTPITLHYKVNGVPLQKQVPLKEGPNRIFVDTTVLGRTAFDTISITLDLTPPGAPKVKGLTPVNTRTPTWTWSGGGGGNGTFRYRVDGEDMTSATILKDTLYATPKDLDPGTHTLFVQERDEAGNWSFTGKHTIRIDTARPAPPEVTTSPASPTNDIRPAWNWSVTGDDIAGLFRYKLNSSDFRSGATETQTPSFRPETKDALQEGAYTLYVQQRDSAGNWSTSGSAALVVDLTPPESPKVTATQFSPTNTQKPEWTWISGSGGMKLYRFKLNDSALTSGALSGSKSSFAPDTALKEGRHVFYVQERDSAGNWSTSGSHALTLDLTPPTAPVFATTPLSPLNSLQPSWTWSSGGGGMGTYRTRVDNADLSGLADTLKQGTFKPSSPLSEGTHTLYIQERDSAGNWSQAASKALILSLRAAVGNPGFSAGEADFLSMAFDDAGIPYVAFADGNNANKVTVMRLNGGSWTLVGLPGFSPGGADYISLTINKAGVPYVAFTDLANGSRATVFRCIAGVWEGVGNAGFSLGYVSSVCLGIGSAGLPYVAYQDQGDTGKASSMRFNGSEWISNGNHGFSAGDASFLSMATDSKGVSYVSYRDGSNAGKATVMRLTGNVWEGVGNAGFSAGRASATSMGISETGTPYVAFVDETSGYKLTVMRLNGSTWENVGSAGFTPGRASIPSLTMGANETPFVAFQDKAIESKLTLMHFNGKLWENVGQPGISAGTAQAISMGLNGLGIPYIAYRDIPSGNRATVIKTAFDP